MPRARVKTGWIIVLSICLGLQAAVAEAQSVCECATSEKCSARACSPGHKAPQRPSVSLRSPCCCQEPESSVTTTPISKSEAGCFGIGSSSTCDCGMHRSPPAMPGASPEVTESLSAGMPLPESMTLNVETRLAATSRSLSRALAGPPAHDAQTLLCVWRI